MILTRKISIFELKPLKCLPLVSRASDQRTDDNSVQFSITRYSAFSTYFCIAILIAHVALFCVFLE